MGLAVSAHAYTVLHRGRDRAAVLPPAPPVAPVPAPVSGDDLVAAVVVASRRAAECCETLARARGCSLARVRSGARSAERRIAGATADVREVGVLAAAASGALLALSRDVARLRESPPEGVEPPDVDGAAWALLVAGCVEGPADDRELAEGLLAWAAEHERYLRPTQPQEVRP